MNVTPFVMTSRVDKQEYKIAFFADQIPPLGYKLYGLRLTDKSEKAIYKKDHSASKNKVNVFYNGMENEFLKVTIQENGGLSVLDKLTGKTYQDCNLFVDEGDAGDEYNYSVPHYDRIIKSGTASVVNVSISASGPLVGSFTVEHRLTVPSKLAENRRCRTEETTTIDIKTTVTLKAGSKHLEFDTFVNNRAKDHRLRVLFPAGIQTDFSHAEGTFTVNKRSVHPKKPEYLGEDPVTTFPQKTFVDLSDQEFGLAVFNKGLPEYEILKAGDGTGIIALTLLRSVGWLARDDFLSRNTGIGSQRSVPTPEAQCLGEYRFSYALMPHAGTWEEAKAHKFAHQYANSLGLHQLEKESNPTVKEGLPTSFSIISFNQPELNVSAVKKAEAGDDLIIRIYNISGKRSSPD